MSQEREKSITELFEEGTAIDEALRSAVREALLYHRKLGNPIAVWENAKLVWVPPEQIDPADLDTRDPSSEEKA